MFMSAGWWNWHLSYTQQSDDYPVACGGGQAAAYGEDMSIDDNDDVV